MCRFCHALRSNIGLFEKFPRLIEVILSLTFEQALCGRIMRSNALDEVMAVCKPKGRKSIVEAFGHECFEVRSYYPTAEGMKPGKGICLQRSQITTLRKALQKAERLIRGEKAAPGVGTAPDEDGQAEGELLEAA
jgi:hypothetical protein